MKLQAKAAVVNVFYRIGAEPGPGSLKVEISPAPGNISGMVGVSRGQGPREFKAAEKPLPAKDDWERGGLEAGGILEI